MTPEQYAKVRDLFDRASELEPDGREAFLSGCGETDEVVLRKVRRMLARERADPRYLEQPAIASGLLLGNAEEFDARLRAELESGGRFTILNALGEGGFGVVYHARQNQPVRRDVALKVIKLGMDTRQLLARFDLERQTLAMMNHPGIARLFDAGATASGRPFFAMELVEGKTITAFCDGAALTVKARLELFLQVLDAIQHAHQKGIIHRDLKPSNVLVVDGRVPSPKIIDFGIARALAREAGVTQGMTQQGQPIGTLAYMSPEQASPGIHDVDTRTDIYSLGVLLYELLTGVVPVEALQRTTSGPVDGMLRERRTPRPSTRVRGMDAPGPGMDIARLRSTQRAQLLRELSGDLDCIVMKALEPDPADRYESAGAFADDLRRFLRCEVVIARPPSGWYRFRKFAQRNRTAFAAASIMVALALTAIVGTSIGLARSLASERKARTQAAISASVNGFLNDDLLASVSPDELGQDVAMREVVRVAAARIEGRFNDQPLVEAAVRLTLGRTLRCLAELEAARVHLDRAMELRESVLGSDDVETLEVVHELGMWHLGRDNNKEAESLLRRALSGRTRHLGPDDPATLASAFELGVALGEQGRLDEAMPFMANAVDRSTQVLGPNHKTTILWMRGLALLYREQGNMAGAGELLGRTYDASRAALGADNGITLLCMNDLAVVWLSDGKCEQASRLFEEARTISVRVRGREHPATLSIARGLARSLRCLKQNQNAQAVLAETLAAAERAGRAGDRIRADVLMELGGIENELEQGKGTPRLVEGTQLLIGVLGQTNPATQRAIARLVAHYQESGDSAATEQWRERLMDPASLR